MSFYKDYKGILANSYLDGDGEREREREREGERELFDSVPGASHTRVSPRVAFEKSRINDHAKIYDQFKGGVFKPLLHR